MFEQAIQIAKKYTLPVFYGAQYMNNEVHSGQASFVILNKDGWFVTATHIFNAYFDYQKHQKNISDYETKLKQIEQAQGVGLKQKDIQKKQLEYNPQWIKNIFYCFGNGKFGMAMPVNLSHNKELDLTVGQLLNYVPNSENEYPMFKNPANISVGAFLCKIGFPNNFFATGQNLGKGGEGYR